MPDLSLLEEKIASKQAIIAVIGLGYVGLPVAACFAREGFSVIGVDIKSERVARINRGQNPIEGREPGLSELLESVVLAGTFQATTDYNQIREADIILIDVETPVGDDHRPAYRALRTVCASLGEVMKPGSLIIVESTVAPGTVEGLVAPLLSQTSGMALNQDFFLGACPERVMPGKLLANLAAISRVCGGSTPHTARTMRSLYRHIVGADLDTSDVVTAELTKTTENAYRDVQIAFANEVARICEANGADVWKVRALVNKSPGRQMLFPGAGVGGHCIPKDPWLLVSSVKGQFQPVLIPSARAVNESMPGHILSLLEEGLAAVNLQVKGAVVCILGYAYLEESDDTRNSPSAVLVQELHRRGAEIRIHDPWVPQYQRDLMDCVENADAVVLMVAHGEYRNVNLKSLVEKMRHPVLIDGRHALRYETIPDDNVIYRCVGIGS
jgi:UDP-N-acetyl-D-mannosaminuronic acid dehydrogenase